MKKTKGFTLIEIIIVIAVLAILTAIMVPIISSSIKNAKIENDKVLVDNMNSIIKSDESYVGRPTSGDEVLWILTGNGFEVPEPNYEKHSFYWLDDDNIIVIYNTEEKAIVYPEDKKLITEDTSEWYNLNGESEEEPEGYKITYYVNGKKIKFKGKISYIKTAEDFILPQPNVNKLNKLGNYIFSGWYATKEALEEAIEANDFTSALQVIPAGDEGEKVFYSSLIKQEIDDDEPNVYSITYNLNGGMFNENVDKFYNGPLEEEIILPIPTRAGYSFVGWFATYNFEDGTMETIIPEGSTGNKVYYAQWSKKVEKQVFTITYYLTGGENPADAPTEYDGTKDVKLPIPTRNGYIFKGWYEDPTFAGDFVETIYKDTTGDKVFYANWEKEIYRPTPNTFYITYVLNGGFLDNPPTVIDGSEDVNLWFPLKIGYEFKGWYLTEDFKDDTKISVITIDMQTEDITVYAKWQAREYDINYVMNGGYWAIDEKDVNSKYNRDESVKYTQEIFRDGYGFMGWYDNPEFNGAPVLETLIGDTGTKTVYAKWQAGVFNLIYITYAAEQNPHIVNRTFTADETVELLIPIRKGFIFKGWYQDDSFPEDATPITIIENATKSVIVYAKWELEPYNIVYELNGGLWKDANPGPSSYTVEEVILLDEVLAEKNYYDFGGWYTTPDFQEGTKYTSIERGTTGDIKLYAKWDGIPYDIPVDFDGGALFNNPVIEFAEELVNDMNAATTGLTSEITQIETFKFSSNDNIGYLWGNGNKEMVDKYQWLFKFAKEEITRAYNTSAEEYATDPKGAYWKKPIYSEPHYQSTMKMLDVLLSQEGDPLYEYKYDAMASKNYDNKNYGDSKNGLYNVGTYLSCDGTTKTYLDYMGDNQTLFRSWLDGLLNSSYFYAADIYRACMIDYSLVENKARFNALYTGTELKVETIEDLPIPIKEGYVFLGWYDNDDPEGENYLAGINYTSTTQVHDYYSNPDNSGKTLKLYAKWKKVPLYNIQFNLSGGHWEHNNLENFTEELLYYFNEKPTTYPNITKDNFYQKAPTYILSVFYDAALLNKYQWLFEYGASIINKTAASSYPSAKTLLNGIITKEYGMMDDNNINYFYEGKTAYESIADPSGAYSAVMEWIHCIINECDSPTGAASKAWIPDYSEQSNMTEFYKAYYATELTMKFYEGLTLPTPVKEGYRFVGWFDEEGNKVTESNITADMTLTAKWEANINNDEDLAAALNTAVSGDIIKINASTSGTYSGDYVINIPLIIQGPNAGIDPNTGERIEEAVFTGTFTINANNVTIDGLSFTGDAQIKTGKVSGFTFKNNHVYDTTKVDVAWAENNTFDTEHVRGFINVYGGNTETTSGYSENLVFTNNLFENVWDINIHISHVENVTFEDNVFYEFGHDAIRFSYGYNGGIINILNNKFIQDGDEENKGYNGIYFRTYSGSIETKNTYTTTITVEQNEFVNIGKEYTYNSNIGLYSGAISARNYRENSTNWIIRNNDFNNCYNYIRIRNQVDVVANHTNYPWDCTISENTFTGIPTDYYFAGWDEYQNDTLAQNPIKAVLENNTYVDNEGNTIENIAPYSAFFQEVANMPLYVGTGEGTNYAYSTITAALSAAQDGDTIIVAEGTYNETLTISVDNLTIKGPNAGVNPNTTLRNNEAVLTGTITIGSSTNGLIIDGLAFTGNAKIEATQVNNFTFQNNNIYDISSVYATWTDVKSDGNGTYSKGFIFIDSNNDSALSTTLKFINNKFNNVIDNNINIASVNGVEFEDNVFTNFGYDAIRFDHNNVCGVISIKNNEFINGGYNGIFFCRYGASSVNPNSVITITGNIFKNIGYATEVSSIYKGAISGKYYQEYGAVWTISNNIFESCSNYIRIRNNATVARHSSYSWACTVENNQFIGLPTDYYFASWNETDSDATTNPETTVFGANYYEDNNNVVISDLSAYSTYFKNVATYGTALSTKPTNTTE